MATETKRSGKNADILPDQTVGERQAVFALEGMTCASCAMRIEKGLKKVPGIKDANVNLATEKATVTFDPAQTTLEQMIHKVDAVGYKATPLVLPHVSQPKVQEPETEASTMLILEGMTCASCAMRIEKGLKKVPGIKDASVNLATEKATVTYDPTQTSLTQMVRSVEAVGYKATAHTEALAPDPATQQETNADSTTSLAMSFSQAEEQSQRRRTELTRKRNLLMLGIVLTLPVVVLGMFFMNAFPGENDVLLALTTPVWALVGWEFHRGAIKTLRHASANMDTLISVGSTAAYLMSVVATFFPQVVGATTFYDTASLIITLIFLGKYLEARAKGQNVILIPTAILSPLIPFLRENAPIFAAAAMALSSVTVVANSLRACLGASITAAKGSFNWIGELEQRPQNQQFRFSNLGVGGDLAYSALQRLGSVVACHPDKVIIILGHNDIVTLVFKNVRRIFGRWKHLPSDPSPEWYRENLQTIVRRLKEETSATIALTSLSQMGEDPESANPVQRELNLRFQQYSEIIKKVARQENVSYIPFYERFHEQIVASPGRAFTAFRFLPFYLDAFRLLVLRRSLDKVAQKNGWRFHTVSEEDATQPVQRYGSA